MSRILQIESYWIRYDRRYYCDEVEIVYYVWAYQILRERLLTCESMKEG